MPNLHSQQNANLVDIVDSLRRQGIGHYINLPQIIVCGDQSSGKSSALEAISGVAFPAKDTVCTRFATELVLRRAPAESINVTIIPGEGRSHDERAKLKSFKPAISSSQLELGAIIEEAKQVMGLSGELGGKGFSTDVLRVELCSPTQPHLTIVDLPGLFRVGNREQAAQDSEVVRSLVLSYMKSERAVILAVVSAKSDFALQEVTHLARQVDPDGDRTLGLITKPDTLDPGSESERYYLQLAQNKDFLIRLGWHVLRNRDFNMRGCSAVDRDAAERRFFSQGVWKELDRACVGVDMLKDRLTKVLENHIMAQLPGVLKDVEKGVKKCTEELSGLGPSRMSTSTQRQYLMEASAKFTRLISDAVYAQYSDPYFATGAEPYTKRLRAVVQNSLTDFAKEMLNMGQAVLIVEAAPTNKARQVLRSTYMERVRRILRENRGCELPGTYNSTIVRLLFQKQSEPWKQILHKWGDKILILVQASVNKALDSILDSETATTLRRIIVNPELHRITQAMKDKTAEILQNHQTGHPITYNHYLTENVQNMQNERRKKDFQQRAKALLGDPDQGRYTSGQVMAVIGSLATHTEADMERYACSEVIDISEAYYKVALKRVIDDFGVLVVESCVLQRLLNLLSSDTIRDLDDATIKDIAQESDRSAAARTRLQERLDILQGGLVVLKKLEQGMQTVAQVEEEQLPCDSEDVGDVQDAVGPDNVNTEGDELKHVDIVQPPSEGVAVDMVQPPRQGVAVSSIPVALAPEPKASKKSKKKKAAGIE